MNFEYGAKALDKVVLFERCQHSVCEKCFVELAARARTDAKCPLCRTPLTETLLDPKAAAQDADELPAAGGDAPESGDAESGAAAGPGEDPGAPHDGVARPLTSA